MFTHDQSNADMNSEASRLIRFSILLISLFFSPNILGAEDSPSVWQPYDESADIAQLADHANGTMRFQLLNSKLLDKNDLWAPFTGELAEFSQSDYQTLKPLILERSVADIQRAIKEGVLSYESLLTFYVYRLREIEIDQGRFLNSVISLNPDAIEQARSLDRANSVVPDNSIVGMPVLLKDNIGFSGLPTTAGAVALQNNNSPDAFITQRLKEAGAIILGKANLSEWAYFFCQQCPSGYSAIGGQTLNPYGRFEFGTGGSSSGSAAATASNLTMLSIGSETSGSILSPASANSLVGFKPTTGSLSRSGIVPIAGSLDTAGPITRSVADAVILFNAMTGFDQADKAMPLLSADLSLEYRLVALQGKRLGAIPGLLENETYSHSLSLLTGDGAVVVELEIEVLGNVGFRDLLGREMVRDLALYLESYASAEVTIESIASLRQFNLADMDIRAPYGQGLIDMMDELEITSSELETLRDELQTAARQQLDQLFIESQIDVLVSLNNYHAGLAALANYPAITIPAGYQDTGQPVGLTLIAPSFQEQALIDIAAKFEALSESRKIPVNYQ